MYMNAQEWKLPSKIKRKYFAYYAKSVTLMPINVFVNGFSAKFMKFPKLSASRLFALVQITDFTSIYVHPPLQTITQPN